MYKLLTPIDVEQIILSLYYLNYLLLKYAFLVSHLNHNMSKSRLNLNVVIERSHKWHANPDISFCLICMFDNLNSVGTSTYYSELPC